jgi:hypothetical protein
MPDAVPVPELDFTIPIAGLEVGARLAVPPGWRAVIIVPLTGGVDRDSPAAADHAEALHRQGFATLLLELPTADETLLAAAVARFVADLAAPTVPIVVLATGPAAPLVQRAPLTVPRILSTVGPRVQGPAHSAAA